MKRQRKRIGEIVVALSGLNLPRESRSFLFRHALQHRFEATTRVRSLSLEMPRAEYKAFGESGGRA